MARSSRKQIGVTEWEVYSPAGRLIGRITCEEGKYVAADWRGNKLDTWPMLWMAESAIVKHSMKEL